MDLLLEMNVRARAEKLRTEKVLSFCPMMETISTRDYIRANFTKLTSDMIKLFN